MSDTMTDCDCEERPCVHDWNDDDDDAPGAWVGLAVLCGMCIAAAIVGHC